MRSSIHRQTKWPCGGKPSANTGFTFAEVLAGMLFLAILAPVLVRGMALATRATALASRSAVAAQLAENQLHALQLDQAWTGAETSGDFEEEWPGYTWTLTSRTWDEDELGELTVEVQFEVQGREQSVRLSTLVELE